MVGLDARLNENDRLRPSGVSGLSSSSEALVRDLDLPRDLDRSDFSFFLGEESPLLNVKARLLGLDRRFFGEPSLSVLSPNSSSVWLAFLSSLDRSLLFGRFLETSLGPATVRPSVLETEPEADFSFRMKSILISVFKDLILSRTFCGIFLVSYE